MILFLTAFIVTLLPLSLYFIWYVCLILDGIQDELDTEEHQQYNHRG
jgi:hypothetical protein